MFRSFLRSYRGSKCPLVVRGTRVALLCTGDSASISYFIGPYLQARGRDPVLIDSATGPSQMPAQECDTVVIVRYLPEAWVTALNCFRAEGGRVVYFMDDDLMDPAALQGLPRPYARKIFLLAIRQRKRIEELCHEFWVSTAYLAEKYTAWNPVRLAPLPSTLTLAQNTLVSVCYHGTASHSAEFDWLPNVIARVQASRLDTTFEIFGDHHVNKTFRRLPRVAILHPMSWTNYLAYTSTVRRDIGLAPLMPGPFNAARGPTKFFDFARMGAVGIYSDVAPYRGFIRDGVDGILLPNEMTLWTDTIAQLAGDEARRTRMAQEARNRALALVKQSCADENKLQYP